MKSVLPILVLAVVATSCSTVYKSGQTPDDVYYSPERKYDQNEYVQMNREDGPSRNNRGNARYSDPYAYDEDSYLRMKVRNRNRWSDLDYYYNDPYAMGYNSRPWVNANIGFWGGNFWNPYSYWNAYNNWNYAYNPFFNPYHRPWGNVVIINPMTNPVYNRPRTYNLNTFNRGGSYNNNPKRSNNNYQTFDTRPYRGSNAGSTGNDMRRTFGNNNNNYSSPSRSSGNSGNSGSSGSNRGSAPVRKF